MYTYFMGNKKNKINFYNADNVLNLFSVISILC